MSGRDERPAPVYREPPSSREMDMRTMAEKFNEGAARVSNYDFGLGRRQFFGRIITDTPYATEVAADTPLAWWRMGDASGAAVDAMSGRNATYSGGVTLGERGVLADNNCALFDGSTGYAQTAEYAQFSLGKADFTLEAWLKWTSKRFCTAVAVRQTSPATTTRIQGLFTVGRFAPGDLSAETWAYIDAETRVRTARPYNDGRFHHVVAVYTAASDVLALYVDTKLQDARHQGGTFTAGQFSATIGRNVSNIQHFPGFIDEVALYASALSESRIAAHYAAGRGWE